MWVYEKRVHGNPNTKIMLPHVDGLSGIQLSNNFASDKRRSGVEQGEDLFLASNKSLDANSIAITSVKTICSETTYYCLSILQR